MLTAHDRAQPTPGVGGSPGPSDRTTGAWLRTRLPGVLASSAIACAATSIARWAPVVGAPVIAIVLGIVVAARFPHSGRLRPGIRFTSRRVLQASVILLGFGLSVRQVAAANLQALPVLIGTLAVGLLASRLFGRLLRLPSNVTTLIGVGTSICGASAIAATEAVVEADQADVSYSIATIFIFNVVAVLAYPTIGHVLRMPQHAFGLWAGTAINDVSSVVAASSVYGPSAMSYAIIVKLTRTLAIIPITLAISFWRKRDGSARNRSEPIRVARSRFAARRVVPLFILGFVAAVLANSAGMVPGAWHPLLSAAAAWMITAALAAVGLSTDVNALRRAGPRPLALGAILWAVVGVSSLLIQACTGSL